MKEPIQTGIALSFLTDETRDGDSLEFAVVATLAIDFTDVELNGAVLFCGNEPASGRAATGKTQL